MSRDPTAQQRPVLTLAMRHYNNGPYVEAALASAFAQTYEPLEIVFVDDCSTDDGFERAQRLVEAYSGPHRVRIARGERNLGVGGQCARVAALATGEIIVIADADDISLPQRCERVYETFRDGGPELLGVITYFDPIDETGAPIPDIPPALIGGRTEAESFSAEQMARGATGPQGAVLAFRRKILDIGLPLDEVRRSEDLVCGFRCGALGRMATIPEVLVQRRLHLDNVSGPVKPSWSGRDLHRWFARYTRDGFAVPSVMLRDVDRFAAAGLVVPARAAAIRHQLALYRRELKTTRVALARGWVQALPAYRRLRRLGLTPRQSLRLMLQAAIPSLAMIFLRRNLTISRRAAAR